MRDLIVITWISFVVFAAFPASYQTAQAHNAAAVSEYNAQDAERRGAVEEERQRRKTSLLLGTQQARFAAQGSYKPVAPTRGRERGNLFFLQPMVSC